MSKKITELDALTIPAGEDSIAVVDFSDIINSPKEMNFDDLFGSMPKSTATKVVAASNTPNADSRSDYQCDGTADNVEIQAAIDALPASGGKVKLLEGTYLVDGVNERAANVFYGVAVGDDTTLEGCGENTIIKLQDESSNQGINNVSVLGNKDVVGGDSGIVIRDLVVDGNKTNQSDPQGDWECLNFKHVTDSQIINSKFINGYMDGVDLDDCEDMLIWGCTAKDCGKSGFHPSVNASNIIVYGCSAIDCATLVAMEASSAAFLLTSTSEYCSFVGCNVENGINAFRMDGKYNSIIGGTVTGITSRLIYQAQANSRNILTDGLNAFVAPVGANDLIHFEPTASRISIVNCVIRHDFVPAAFTGIVMGGIPSYSIVNNNLVENFQKQIIECQAAETNIVIVGNNFAPNAEIAVDLNNSTECVVYGNTFISGAAGALVINAGAGCKIGGNSGYATRNRGTATVAAGNVAETVAHGLDVTPAASDISVVATADIGNATRFWVTNIGAANFDITVDIAPGGAGATFAWEVDTET